MCRTVHALLQTVICGIQMLVRVFMTIILMMENLIRMILQTLYNFISFMLQMLSLMPICVVFLLTARLKCFMCGGGGPCPVNRGGTCDCLMSAIAIVIVFLIFRATGILDKIFYRLGYAKALGVTKWSPTPGDITECSRNESEDEFTETTTTETYFTETPIKKADDDIVTDAPMYDDYSQADNFVNNGTNETEYNTTQYNATQYNATQYNATQYNATHYNATQYNATQYNATQYNATQYNATQYNATQYNATQYNATQYNATRYTTRYEPDCMPMCGLTVRPLPPKFRG